MNDLIMASETETAYELGSHNHSAIQANLAFLLKRLDKYRSYAVAITAISGGCRQDASVPGATA